MKGLELVKTKDNYFLLDKGAKSIEGKPYFYNNDYSKIRFFNKETNPTALTSTHSTPIIAYYPLTMEALALDIPLLPSSACIEKRPLFTLEEMKTMFIDGLNFGIIHYTV